MAMANILHVVQNKRIVSPSSACGCMPKNKWTINNAYHISQLPSYIVWFNHLHQIKMGILFRKK